MVKKNQGARQGKAPQGKDNAESSAAGQGGERQQQSADASTAAGASTAEAGASGICAMQSDRKLYSAHTKIRSGRTGPQPQVDANNDALANSGQRRTHTQSPHSEGGDSEPLLYSDSWYLPGTVGLRWSKRVKPQVLLLF